MRLYNLSLPKSATTAVCLATRRLGMRGFHWPDLSLTLDKYLSGQLQDLEIYRHSNSSFGDAPVALMYRQLYDLYPECKFLLVQRDRQRWIKSLRKHLIDGRRPVDPVYTCLFGYPTGMDSFNEQICLRTYDRFHADAQVFFRNKENFLHIRMQDLSWRVLCNFLDKPIPCEPFPWANTHTPRQLPGTIV